MIEVVDPGLLTTIQDIGRPGYAHLGVPPSGACDPVSLAVGNRLVGNPPGVPALEATLIGPRLRFARPTLVALTGACESRVEECVELDVGRAVGGARIYVCVAGGIDAEPVLGSCSTDLLSGLGPSPLRAGDVLRVGAPGTPGEAAAASRTRVLRVVSGPREDWFASPEHLCSTEWKVTASSNRVGIRLDGPPLERARTDELRSEGLVTGALQVPPNGKPILLLNDHPTTGGYPVIGVVHSGDLPSAGQLAPGDVVAFRLN
ncbi:MAG TPA: biotin-dependent carboxyltransferase family protein [Gaiellaceae bacterium]|nr:biotin-dependent carboxyltransferase family protein [Gaiellaceae bacterium]